MNDFQLKLKKTVFIFLSVIVALIIMVSLNNCSNGGAKEIRNKYKLSDSECYFRAYESTPQIVIDKIKEYINSQGLSGEGIEFVTDNKYKPSFSKETFKYHVEQYYKSMDCAGSFDVNLEGEISNIKNLKTAAELAHVSMDTTINRTDAIGIASDYLKLKDFTVDEVHAYLYRESVTQKLIFIYEVKFTDQCTSVYIDGVTGRVIK